MIETLDQLIRRWTTQGPYREEREAWERDGENFRRWDTAEREYQKTATLREAAERKGRRKIIHTLISIGIFLFVVFWLPGLLDSTPHTTIERALSQQVSECIDKEPTL